ncbi:hypothetical protein [Chitinophaga rhizophila]|uniref:Uncharacterized protein n=1 Tax=Chitinophaga rhizophila TaxID=2866212 RepID=A0ABS7G6B6_9BACT|nr:hypothetical protein [Chitinophaga rhizophila]MBW8683193.1 hypothetical protein [Chitinophaga rhizophila]
MRSLSVRALALVTTIAVVSCNKQSAVEKLNPDGNAVAATAEPSRDARLLADLFKSAAPKTSFFTVSAKQPGTLSTPNGTRYTIPPGALRRKDGSVPTGPVSVAIREVYSPKDFVLTNRPTATNGQYLLSYGEFFVRATEGGADLTLAAPIAVQAPVRAQVRPQEKVPMWDGDTSVYFTVNGHNQFNQPTSVIQPASQDPGINWNAAPDFALFNPGTGTLDFQLSQLIQWRNCDVFSGTTGPKTTVLGYFNIYNDDTPSSSPEQPSMLFFKPKTINSVVKFFNIILNAPNGFKGFLSYQNVIPVGQQGSFLAITALGGQFYAELKDVTIAPPASGTNYTPVSFNLQPVTGAQLLTLIADLNNR